MAKIGIYEADHHYFITDVIDVSKVEDEARERLKPNSMFGRDPQTSVVHFHKQDVAACAGYRHDEYRQPHVMTSTPMNADDVATQLHTGFGTAEVL